MIIIIYIYVYILYFYFKLLFCYGELKRRKVRKRISEDELRNKST